MMRAPTPAGLLTEEGDVACGRGISAAMSAAAYTCVLCLLLIYKKCPVNLGCFCITTTPPSPSRNLLLVRNAKSLLIVSRGDP